MHKIYRNKMCIQSEIQEFPTEDQQHYQTNN